MSDRISDARRASYIEFEIQIAARRLVEVLNYVRDAAFGYPPGVLDTVNDELRNAGVIAMEAQKIRVEILPEELEGVREVLKAAYAGWVPQSGPSTPDQLKWAAAVFGMLRRIDEQTRRNSGGR